MFFVEGEDNVKGLIEATKIFDNKYYKVDTEQALDILTSYLLGDDWYVVDSMSTEQCNAIVVEQILDKYSKQWRKDWKTYEKTQENS